MKTVMIGAGNLATHLAKALRNAGFDMVQIYNRTERPAAELADLVQSRYTTDIASVRTDASLYIVSVSDDAIPQVAEALPLSKQFVVHTAGSVPANVFSGKFENYGVIYPLQTFSKSRPVDFENIPVFLEANTCGNLEKLRQVAERISGKIYQADSSQRMFLHLAAVFGCNFVNYLYGVAAGIVEQAGFGFDILSPLIDETASKAMAAGDPQTVQTGPARRNDTKVMQKHLEFLVGQPSLQKLYEQISRNISSER